MATFKIWNIGKANERIDVLEKELASLKAAAPATDAALATQLEEAKASNDQLSQQLTKVEADHKAEVSTLKTSLEKAQGEVNQLGGALKAACDANKLQVKDGATSAELISALQAGVSSTLAKLHVSTADIPAGKAEASATAAAAANKTELKGRSRMLSAMRIEGVTSKN